MSVEFYTFLVHFSKKWFLVFSTNFEPKPHGKPIRLDFWAQMGGFWGVWNFFLKNYWFSGEKRKKKNLILFASERPQTDMSHKLLLFLLYKLIKTGIKGQNGQFLAYLVIFGHLYTRQNWGGIERPNGHFLPWIWKFNVWSTPGCIWLIPHHSAYPLKMRSKFNLLKKKTNYWSFFSFFFSWNVGVLPF